MIGVLSPGKPYLVKSSRTSSSTSSKSSSLVRQDHDAWQVTLPPEAICLPNDIVVRMVIHQLATLTEEAGGQTNREEKVELSRVLNVLLQK